jgi:hypothetical protein
MRVVQVYFTLRVHAYSWSYLKIIGVGAVAALSGLAVRNISQHGHFLLSLLVTAGVMLLLYALLIWKTCFEEADRMILEKIRKKLRI